MATERRVPPQGDSTQRALIWLFAAWLATRVVLTLLMLADAEIVGATDVWRYNAVAEALVHGNGDQRVRVWEYPIGSLAVTLPPMLLGARDALDYLIVFVAFSVGFDFLALIGVLLAAPRGRLNMAGGWLWVACPTALGFLTLSRLDLAACALAAIGLSAVLRRNLYGVGSVALAFGAAIKVWPGLVGGAILVWAKDKVAVVKGFALVGALSVVAIGVFDWWYISLSFLTYQRDRGLQIESFPALFLLWAEKLNLADYEVRFQFGSQQLVGAGTSLLARASSICMLASVALVAAVGRSRLVRMFSTEQRITFVSLLLVSALILTNKVFSAQYILWIAIMVAIAMGWHPRINVRGTFAGLMAASLLTHVIFPHMYGALIQREWTAVLLLTIRDLLMVAVLWQAIGSMLRPDNATPGHGAARSGGMILDRATSA